MLLRPATVASDMLGVSAAALAAVEIRNAVVPAETAALAVDWSLVVLPVSVILAFHAGGLYEREVYVSRVLHVLALARASLAAFVMAALAAYLLRSPIVVESRLLLLLAITLAALFTAALRLGVMDRLYTRWVDAERPVALVAGDSPDASLLADRLKGLREFHRVEPVDRAACTVAPEEYLRRRARAGASRKRPVDAIFVDSATMSPRDVFGLASAAGALGIRVYVLSRLLQPLESSRVLTALFHAPVIRVRGVPKDARPYRLKRAFDLAGSGALLLLSSPLMLVLAALIRATSPGPVFYRQTRVGRFGVPFEFLKFRSMVAGDSSAHSAYVRSLINGTAEPTGVDEDGRPVFKQVDDPRITRVGRFIRKYSLDEIPQFWNVFRGDMSLVGPRPPLPYEVSEYDEWHQQRLTVPSGLTGVWQVAGRSRVSFEEMTLQDLMYARNMRLLVDLKLCVKTVPAALLGHGGG